ncbi:MAG: rRNA adenine N(6)-methyltransferase family protein [Candidatus Chisholmbacteria bacterium]|nr:rRNA adenine N(6)-methyltransferase family protein [Candidatus Chisholmbacteria bacterium]
MYQLRRRRQLSQVFLRNRILVRKLVRRSSIGPQDLVFEIGPGGGIITQELVKVARQVITIELDAHFYHFLRRRFAHARNLSLYHADALQYRFPSYPYKVFANIPFSIEGKLLRQLIDSQSPPQDCYLVMRRAVAERLGGIYKEGMFSITHKPWFRFEIFHRFHAHDFTPVSSVNPVMLRITKRDRPLLPLSSRISYSSFIRQAFVGGRRLRYNLNRPSHLTLEQWIKLFSLL